MLTVWCWLVALVFAVVLALPPGSSLAMCLHPVLDDCSKLLTRGLACFVLDKEPWFDSSTGSSLAAAHGADSGS